jgi:uncharacterized damage-inducible protein DinB
VTRLEELADLLAYHRWANARILDAAAALPADALDRDLGNSFPSVRATLAHVVGADWIWLRRWCGDSPTAPPPWELATHAEISARWREVAEGQIEFLAGLAEADVDRIVAYRALNGSPYENPLGDLIRHLVNHGTYHRGQVVTMLRQLGIEPPHTDLIVYYRERA